MLRVRVHGETMHHGIRPWAKPQSRLLDQVFVPHEDQVFVPHEDQVFVS